MRPLNTRSKGQPRWSLKGGGCEVRIAGVNRWAARQQRVRKGWAAVILQRTKQRIGVDLIARASQITAAVIAAEVVSKRRDGAAVIEDVFARCAGIQDCVGDLNDNVANARLL